jgi:hypothetical protein
MPDRSIEQLVDPRPPATRSNPRRLHAKCARTIYRDERQMSVMPGFIDRELSAVTGMLSIAARSLSRELSADARTSRPHDCKRSSRPSCRRTSRVDTTPRRRPAGVSLGQGPIQMKPLTKDLVVVAGLGAAVVLSLAAVRVTKTDSEPGPGRRLGCEMPNSLVLAHFP